jgi:hypothetical protein
MKQTHATFLAFFGASLIPATYLAVAYPLSGERDWQSVLGSFFVIYFISAAATALVGVPAFLVLSKFDLVTWWSALSGGALVGILAKVTVTSNYLGDIQSLSRFAMLGAVAGLLFWLVWRTGSSGTSRGAQDAA